MRLLSKVGVWFWLSILIGAVPISVLAQAPDPAKVERQRRIESGETLTSRAQRVLFRCRTQQDEGNHRGAVEIMNAWLEGDDERRHPLLLYHLAVSQVELDDRTAALKSLREAVGLEPDFARAWLRLGEVAYGEGTYAEAAEAFTRGYGLTPKPDHELQYYIGVAWLQADEPQRAMDVLSTLLDQHRAAADLDWYRALVAAAVQTDRPDRAGRYLDHLLADHPVDPEAWELAYQHSAQGENYRQAVVYLTIAGYLRPLGVTELEQLGDLYVAIDVPLTAARYYQRALENEPTEPDPKHTTAQIKRHERLASAWLAAHRRDEARATLQTALNRYDTPELWSLLGDLEYLAEDYAQALAAFSKSCDLDPEYGRGWLMMGYCAIELGDENAARDHLRQAAEFPAQAKVARRRLGQLN